MVFKWKNPTVFMFGPTKIRCRITFQKSWQKSVFPRKRFEKILCFPFFLSNAANHTWESGWKSCWIWKNLIKSDENQSILLWGSGWKSCSNFIKPIKNINSSLIPFNPLRSAIVKRVIGNFYSKWKNISNVLLSHS